MATQYLRVINRLRCNYPGSRLPPVPSREGTREDLVAAGHAEGLRRAPFERGAPPEPALQRDHCRAVLLELFEQQGAAAPGIDDGAELVGQVCRCVRGMHPFKMEASMNLKKACFLSLSIACVLAPLAYGRKHHTTITWDRSASPEVVGYNVYRGDDRGKENPLPVAKLAESECCKKSAPKCKWDDYDVVSGAKHCYVVKAVLRSGNVLDPASEEACAATP